MFNLLNEQFKQPSFFFQPLESQLDLSNRYVQLSKGIHWNSLCEGISKFYVEDKGRSSLSFRLMIGLTIVKYIDNLSDDRTIQLYKENPYVQYFCGGIEFTNKAPCSNAMLSIFRRKIGPEGCKFIMRESIRILGDMAKETSVICDTTAHIKNITFPTDIKLLVKICIRCQKLAKKYGIKLKNTFKKQIKELLKIIRFEKSNKKKKVVKAAKKRIWTIAGILVRELRRKFSSEQLIENNKDFGIYEKVLKQTSSKNNFYQNANIEFKELNNAIDICKKNLEKNNVKLTNEEEEKIKNNQENFNNAKGRGKKQTKTALKTLRSICKSMVRKLEKKSSNKELLKKDDEIVKIKNMLKEKKDTRIYSLHEPEVGCITKGKAGVKHEYGSKASIVVTKNSGVIVGAADFARNPNDSTTLKDSIDSVRENTGNTPQDCYVDRGYRGAQEKNSEINVHIPSSPTGDMTDEEKSEARVNFGRRSSVEPIIAHLKSDHRLNRNYLEGRIGDKNNLLLACSAYNFKKWIINQSDKDKESAA